MTDIVERKPAMVQIAVDIIFGLMPVRRARSALVADARTESAKRVCPSNHQSAMAMIGTMINTVSCGPVTVTLPTSHSPVIGVGYWLWNLPVRYSGI